MYNIISCICTKLGAAGIFLGIYDGRKIDVSPCCNLQLSW